MVLETQIQAEIFYSCEQLYPVKQQVTAKTNQNIQRENKEKFQSPQQISKLFLI